MELQMAYGDERDVFLAGGKHRIDIKTLREEEAKPIWFYFSISDGRKRVSSPPPVRWEQLTGDACVR